MSVNGSNLADLDTIIQPVDQIWYTVDRNCHRLNLFFLNLLSICHAGEQSDPKMIDCSEFFETLGQNGVGMYAGVRDSLLKDSVRTLPIMQSPEIMNSGMGNAINPILSLIDPPARKIPS